MQERLDLHGPRQGDIRLADDDAIETRAETLVVVLVDLHAVAVPREQVVHVTVEQGLQRIRLHEQIAQLLEGDPRLWKVPPQMEEPAQHMKREPAFGRRERRAGRNLLGAEDTLGERERPQERQVQRIPDRGAATEVETMKRPIRGGRSGGRFKAGIRIPRHDKDRGRQPLAPCDSVRRKPRELATPAAAGTTEHEHAARGRIGAHAHPRTRHARQARATTQIDPTHDRRMHHRRRRQVHTQPAAGT